MLRHDPKLQEIRTLLQKHYSITANIPLLRIWRCFLLDNISDSSIKATGGRRRHCKEHCRLPRCARNWLCNLLDKIVIASETKQSQPLVTKIATLLSVVRNDDFPRWGEACVFSMHPACLQMILIYHGLGEAFLVPKIDNHGT